MSEKVPHDENRIAELADRRKGIGAAGGDADRRQRLLVGFRRHRDIVKAVILANMRKPRR
jgi:hypothetical protein